MKCQCCQDAKLWPGTVAARTFTPACIWCGARKIKLIGTYRSRPREEIVARKRATLQLWMQHGHNEFEIRRLVALDALPYEPEESSEKPRKRGA